MREIVILLALLVEIITTTLENRRLTGLLQWESLLGIAVLICTGLLSIFAGTLQPATAHQAQLPQVKAFTTMVKTSDKQFSLTLTVSPDSSGPNTFTIAVFDSHGVKATNISVSIYATMLEMDMGTTPIKLQPDGKGNFSAPANLDMGGKWGLRVEIRAPGLLIAYGNSGMAHSSDDGDHWQVIAGTTGGVFGMTASGPHSPIYASGDAGIYVSNDSGKTFKLVYTQSSFGSLIASPLQTQLLYGKTGQAVYRSTDGGRTWSTLPAIKGNLQNLVPDLHNSAWLYLSLSYPMEIYRFDQTNGQWTSLTPKV